MIILTNPAKQSVLDELLIDAGSILLKLVHLINFLRLVLICL